MPAMNGDAKSLLVSNLYFPPQKGGISHFMSSVATSLGRERVCCLTAVKSDRHEMTVCDKGIRVYRRPLAFSGRTAVQAVNLGFALSQIMVMERPQIIQLAMAYEGYIGLQLQRWIGLPFVVYAHGNEILDAANGKWQTPRLALMQAARVFANSRFTAGLLQGMGVKPERIEIVWPGCDAKRFKPQEPSRSLRDKFLGSRQNGRVILTVGLESLKGHDMVIRALPRIRRSFPDITYLIVGGGSQDKLDALARELGVRNHVIFSGLVSDEDIPGVYGLCDVFAMPSRQDLAAHNVEGFGLAYLEANASGKPVVGGKSGGVEDAVVEGLTGLLVNPLDPEDIASALETLLGKPDFARSLGEHGRQRVVNEFAWDTIGKRVQSILNSVVQSGT